MSLEFRQPAVGPADGAGGADRRTRLAMSWCALVPGSGLVLLGEWMAAVPYLAGTAVLVAVLATTPPALFVAMLVGAWAQLSLWGQRPVMALVGRTTLAPEQLRLAAAEQAAPGAGTCPRCRSRPRDISGWCATCRTELVPWPELDAGAQAMVEASNSRARKSTKMFGTYPQTMHGIDGTTMKVTKAGAEVLTRLMLGAFPDLRLHSDYAMQEPGDPNTGWVRITTFGHAAESGEPLYASRLTRVRLEGGVVHELWQCHALPTPAAAAPDSRAA